MVGSQPDAVSAECVRSRRSNGPVASDSVARRALPLSKSNSSTKRRSRRDVYWKADDHFNCSIQISPSVMRRE